MKVKKEITFLTQVALIFFVLLPIQASSADNSTPVSNGQPFIFGGLAWSSDDKLLAVGTSGGVCLHKASDLVMIGCHLTQSEVYAVDWQPNGNLVADAIYTGSGSQPAYSVEVWDSQTEKIVSETSGFEMVISSVVWSPDGNKIAAASLDGTAQISDPLTGEVSHKIKIEDIGFDYSLSWTPNSKLIILQRAATAEFTAWDTMTGKLIRSWENLAFSGGAKLSPDGTMQAATTFSGEATIWNVDTGSVIAELKVDNSRIVGTTAWSPDSSRIALMRDLQTKSKPGYWQLEIWDIASRQRLVVIPDIYIFGDGHYNNAIAWSHDGKRLASISDDGKVYIWDAETYKQIAIYEAYSPTN